MATGSEILLTKQQHSDLSSIAQSRALPAGYVFRAKLILMLAEGASFNAIMRQLQTTSPTIVRWKQRFRQHGLWFADKKGEPRRSISECIALLAEDSTATIDADFARDVAAAVESHREPLEPPAWD